MRKKKPNRVLGFAIVSILILVMLAELGIIIYNIYAKDELHSPCDRIKSDDINIDEDKITIWLSDADTTNVKGSGSMSPTFAGESDLLYVVPQKESDICVGDIIVYKESKEARSVVHRVIKIEEDALGTYFITKGDHNKGEDSFKPRFNNIKWVVVGILY